MSQRDYNRVYTCGRFIAQVMQDGQHDGIIVDLIPGVTVSINNGRLLCGFALRWITGDLCFGIMTKTFSEVEKKRTRQVKEIADKAGLTVRQQELRWGW